MDTATRRDINASAKDIRCDVTKIHQVKQTERPFLAVDEHIDIAVLPSLITGNRAKEIKMPRASLFQLRPMLPQYPNDFVSPHVALCGRSPGYRRMDRLAQ